MNIFEDVKDSITTRQAAEMYGIQVRRNGMACCPFHRDKNPSMKVDRRFHCFGCQADGDVIDFTAQVESMVQADQSEKRPASIVRNVGGRTYTVLIHFNEDARESVDSKMERVILADLAGMAG